MTAGQLWALIGLGVFHGVNPGMGWLLAASRGLQERSRAALLWSLPALALGHAASIALVALVITVTGSLVATRWFPVVGGVVVAGAGVWVLMSRWHRHQTDARMSLWQIGVWSFLMASMHGAGLMVLPVLSGDLPHAAADGAAGHGAHGAASQADPAEAAGHAPPPDTWELSEATLLGLAATGVHTIAMFAAAGVAALIAYDFLGVQAMRLRWVTMDRVWAFALIASGALVLWTAA